MLRFACRSAVKAQHFLVRICNLFDSVRGTQQKKYIVFFVVSILTFLPLYINRDFLALYERPLYVSFEERAVVKFDDNFQNFYIT